MIIVIDVMIFVIRIMLTCMLCMLRKYCEIMVTSKVYAIWGTLWNYGNIKKDLWNMHLEFVKYGSPNLWTCEFMRPWADLWIYVARGHLWIMNLWGQGPFVNYESMWPRAICEIWSYVSKGHMWILNLCGQGPTCDLWSYEAKGQTCELVNPKGRRPMW